MLTTFFKHSHILPLFSLPMGTMSQWVSQDTFRIHEQRYTVGNKYSPHFSTIAAEICLKVIEHLHTAKDLAHLSETCTRFRDLIVIDGWRVFVQVNFPSLIKELPHGIENTAAEWKDLADSLTSQSRAWDKRAIATTSLTADPRQIFQNVNASRSDLHFEDDSYK